MSSETKVYPLQVKAYKNNHKFCSNIYHTASLLYHFYIVCFEKRMYVFQILQKLGVRRSSRWEVIGVPVSVSCVVGHTRGWWRSSQERLQRTWLSTLLTQVITFETISRGFAALLVSGPSCHGSLYCVLFMPQILYWLMICLYW